MMNRELLKGLRSPVLDQDSRNRHIVEEEYAPVFNRAVLLNFFLERIVVHGEHWFWTGI